MDEFKPRKRNTGKIILIVAVVLILAVAVLWIIATRRSAMRTPEGGMAVTSPVGKLYYPEKWKDQLRTEKKELDNSQEIAFYSVTESGEARIFDVIFGDCTELFLGVVKNSENQSKNVYLRVYELSDINKWKEADRLVCMAMQEDLNYLVAHLPLLEQSETQQKTEYADIPIDTPYGQLHYPGQWKSMIRIEQKTHPELRVSFFGKVEDLPEIPLFDISFGATGENAIGILEFDGNGISVGVTAYPIEPTEMWSQKCTDTLFAMQDDMNYLIQRLELKQVEEQFIPASAYAQPQAAEGAMKIVTSFCDLEFPAKWEDYVKIETDIQENGRVSFFAVLPGREQLPIFDIVFGDTEKKAVGYVRGQDTEKIPVTVEMHTFAFETDWTEEEKSTVYRIAEDLNFLLTKLTKNPRYSQDIQ